MGPGKGRVLHCLEVVVVVVGPFRSSRRQHGGVAARRVRAWHHGEGRGGVGAQACGRQVWQGAVRAGQGVGGCAGGVAGVWVDPGVAQAGGVGWGGRVQVAGAACGVQVW